MGLGCGAAAHSLAYRHHYFRKQIGLDSPDVPGFDAECWYTLAKEAGYDAGTEREGCWVRSSFYIG